MPRDNIAFIKGTLKKKKDKIKHMKIIKWLSFVVIVSIFTVVIVYKYTRIRNAKK